MAQANTINPDDTTNNAHFSGITQFNSIMRAYNAAGLRYDFKYYDGDDHGSVPMIAEYDALRFIFAGYKPDLQRIIASPRLLPEHFKNVSAKLGTTFTPSERLVQTYAQISLSQDTTKAMEFLKYATEWYPQSYRNFDRLGTLAAARGDKTKAKEYFERSLALNPSNATTREALKKVAP